MAVMAASTLASLSGFAELEDTLGRLWLSLLTAAFLFRPRP